MWEHDLLLWIKGMLFSLGVFPAARRSDIPGNTIYRGQKKQARNGASTLPSALAYSPPLYHGKVAGDLVG